MVCNPYMKNRTIFSCVGGILSKTQPISSGVPQGSVLGPLLFVLFLSDLPSVVSGLSALFANDTLPYDSYDGRAIRQIVFLLQSAIHRWSNEWATTFNPAKSAVVDFRGKRKKQGGRSASPSFGTMSVPVCEKVKHLGIQRLTSTLS